MRGVGVRHLVLLGWLLAAPAAWCADAPGVTAEIAYLLAAVSTSGCRFERNGLSYDASQATEHLRRKYDLMVAAGRITSAEDFIERAGSVSSVTGRPYHISCPGIESEPARSWLTRALLARRKAAPPLASDGAAR